MQDTAIANTTVLDPTEDSAAFESEGQLSTEIGELWMIHVEAKNASDQTKQELRSIRLRLAERLYTMKKLLARPGRNGQWSSFLASQSIARASADRMVRRHENMMNPQQNRISEAITTPTDDDVQRLFATIYKQLRNVLTTEPALELFLAKVRNAFRPATQEELEAAFAVEDCDCPLIVRDNDGDSFIEETGVSEQEALNV